MLRRLKGHQPKEVKELDKGSRYAVTAPNGEVMQINGTVQSLYQNSTVVQNLTLVYSEPLKKPRRKKVQSYVKDDASTVVEVPAQEAQILAETMPLPLAEPGTGEQETENTSIIFLSPKRGSFEGEGAQWSFRKGGRQGEVLHANIKDKDFLHKLETGEYRLSGGDVLKVEMREKQRVVGSDIKTTNDILRVLDYRPAPINPVPKQATLDLGGTE